MELRNLIDYNRPIKHPFRDGLNSCIFMREQEDNFHPILERSWEYEVVSVCFRQSLNDEFEAHLDLTLRNDKDVRHLRFFSPQDIEIEKGFPIKTGGFSIYDVSARGLEKLNIRVDDFEASFGAIRFWARKVEEIQYP